MQAKLIISFEHLNEADFLTKSGTIVSGVTSNINCQEPWLQQVPSLTALTLAFTDYETAYHDAINKDVIKIGLRKGRRVNLTNMLKQLAPYFELVAQNNIAKLETTGYDLRRDITHKSGVDPLPAPKGFQLSRGTLPCTVDVKVCRLDGASSYEVQITELDPLIENNWKFALASTAATHILLDNLVSKNTYWVRVRAIGTNGAGEWTDPLSVVAL